MKNVLYIGNKLQKKQSNTSYIEVLGALLEGEGYRLTYASGYSQKGLRFLDMLYAVVKYRKQTDVVLIDTYSTLNFYYAFAVSQLCRWFDLLYIPLLHGGNLPARLKADPKLARLVFKHAHTNVAPSPYLKAAFEDYGYTNVVFIPNTIELINYPFEPRGFDTPKLLWVRSFAKIYNPQLAVQVLKALKDKGIDTELCMVGPDSDGSLQTIKQLAKDLNVNVTFRGKLSKPEWATLSKKYNVFINTTNFDNTPISVIEAMALGLPIVSTNVGGMPYLIAHETHGLLVNPNDALAMAAAIERLFAYPELRAQLISEARQLVAQFDWTTVKEQWNVLFDEIASLRSQ
jgi:glycosyltransferase involved in cell wall biosynthesis